MSMVAGCSNNLRVAECKGTRLNRSSPQASLDLAEEVGGFALGISAAEFQEKKSGVSFCAYHRSAPAEAVPPRGSPAWRDSVRGKLSLFFFFLRTRSREFRWNARTPPPGLISLSTRRRRVSRKRIREAPRKFPSRLLS
jgi:hypothetical protein